MFYPTLHQGLPSKYLQHISGIVGRQDIIIQHDNPWGSKANHIILVPILFQKNKPNYLKCISITKQNVEKPFPYQNYIIICIRFVLLVSPFVGIINMSRRCHFWKAPLTLMVEWFLAPKYPRLLAISINTI